MSIGEDKIATILSKEKIKYTREYTFSDLKHGLLRFDFYLSDLNILIEFDGQQHLSRVEFFQKTRADFTKACERDRVKNSYALQHKIPLYRIPYWEIDIIKSFKDMLNPAFLVKTKYHNDNLRRNIANK